MSVIFNNLHTHTQFCDGQDTMEEMVQAAVAANMRVLGFSPHGPAEYDEVAMCADAVSSYLSEITRLRWLYSKKITILAGMERDALAPADTHGLDYIIGAVHYLKDGRGGIYCIDHTQDKLAEAIACFGDARTLAAAYADTYAAMLTTFHPLIAGHLDIITKLNSGNCFFNTDSLWYRQVEAALVKAVQESGAIVEVNTAGMCRPGGQPYPGKTLLRNLYENGVPVTLSSDAHCARDIARFFPRAVDLLRDIGFSSVKVFGPEGFYDQPLELCDRVQ